MTGFCSVIFPANLPYLPAFLRSLEAQTDQDFVLILGNDGVPDLASHFNGSSLQIRFIELYGSLAQNRSQFLWCLASDHAFDNYIFGDTDDFFSPNRVAECKQLLQQHDVVVSDLCLVNAAGDEMVAGFWKDRVELKQPITWESLVHYNFMGLGNTALRARALPTHVAFPDSLQVIDWYFFTELLMRSPLKVVFSPESVVFYRQHDANMVGRTALNRTRYIRGLEVKYAHYSALSKEFSYFSDLEKKYRTALEQSPGITEGDVPVLKCDNPFWWEEIK